MDETEPDEIADLFTPWDARAWDNLRATHGDTAARLEALVTAGTTPAAIRRYAEKRSYPPKVIGWLEQAARHVQRQQAGEAQPRPAGD